MKKEFRPDFIIIPSVLLADKKLTPSDRIVYGVIYWFEKLKEGTCTASNETIARIAVVSEKAVMAALNRLEKRGYILRFYDDPETKRHRNNIVTKVSFNAFLDDISKGSATIPDPTNEGSTDPTNEGQSKNILSKNILSKDNTETAPSYGNNDINNLIQALKESNGGFIDGSQQINRRYCYLLLNKFGYKQDKEKAVATILFLIKKAKEDGFHGSNATSFKYIYYNAIKIGNNQKNDKNIFVAF